MRSRGFSRVFRLLSFREAQEGCGGLREENPGAFPKAGPISSSDFEIPCRKLPKPVCCKTFPARISDSHDLLEFSDSCTDPGNPLLSYEW